MVPADLNNEPSKIHQLLDNLSSENDVVSDSEYEQDENEIEEEEVVDDVFGLAGEALA